MAVASRMVARIAGERCSVFSMILLSRFSMAQANSADIRGSDHAAGTLQRMERAAHPGKRIRLERVLLPGREQLGDSGNLFPGLFYI